MSGRHNRIAPTPDQNTGTAPDTWIENTSTAPVIVFGPQEALDYHAKKNSPVKSISQYPRKFFFWKKFKPKYTVYNNREENFYVLSDDELLICDSRDSPKNFNKKKGCVRKKVRFGMVRDLKVKDMTLTTSGGLIFVDERHAFSLSLHAEPGAQEEYKVTRMADFTKAIQVCSHDEEFIVLDIGHKCLQKFTIGTNMGACIKTFGSEIADKLNVETVMCLDNNDNIYVTAGCEVKGREDGQTVAYRCQKFMNVTVTFQMLIARYDVDGKFDGDDYIRLEEKKTFLQEIESFCPWYHRHNDFPKQDVPKDDAIKRMTRIRGIFVDNQGMIVISRPRMNRIDVFTDKGEHHCTIVEPGRHQGNFEFPTGVCLTTDGKLVSSDPEKGKLQFL